MARQNHTAERITDALISLMHSRPYGDISISDITREAKVSRISFYRNFSEKEDILRNYIDSVVDRIQGAVAALGCGSTLSDYFGILFQTIGPYSETIREIFRAHLGELILSAFNANLFRTPLKENDLSLDLYQVRFYAGAFFNVFSAWIQDGKQESPEQMAAICCRMMN